jgi:unsaturated rhamnogalacturonyl hydrolase
MAKVLLPTAVKLCNTIMKDFPGMIIKKWQYDAGLCLLGFDAVYKLTGDKRYNEYIHTFYDYFIHDDGTIETYDPQVRNIDHINCGKNLFLLLEETGDEKYAKAIELLASQLEIQPKTPSGAYWHKNIYPNQVWLDGIFMGEPFSARYAKEFNHPEKYDEILTQFVVAEKSTYEPRCGLYAHACDESKQMFWADKNTGRSLNVWGRSVGWFCMAMVDTLDFIPEERNDIRRTLIEMFNKVIGNVVKYQDKDGVWLQVLDCSRSDNYQEATCTCQFAYAINKAINKGYIDKETYKPYLEKAIDGIKNVFIREDDENVYIGNCCSVAGLGPDKSPHRNGTLDYYFSEPIRDNDFKGVGPFLLLATEYEG